MTFIDHYMGSQLPVCLCDKVGYGDLLISSPSSEKPNTRWPVLVGSEFSVTCNFQSKTEALINCDLLRRPQEDPLRYCEGPASCQGSLLSGHHESLNYRWATPPQSTLRRICCFPNQYLMPNDECTGSLFLLSGSPLYSGDSCDVFMCLQGVRFGVREVSSSLGFRWDFQRHHSANCQTLHWTEHLPLEAWPPGPLDSLRRFQRWFGQCQKQMRSRHMDPRKLTPSAINWELVSFPSGIQWSGGEPKPHGHFAPPLYARLNIKQVKSLHARQSGKHCGVTVTEAECLLP